MTSQTHSLNVTEPVYFHREYQNDIPDGASPNDWMGVSKRIATVALPFVSLYKPLSFPLALTTGGLRVITSITQLLSDLSKGDNREISIDALQTAIAVVALGGTIFAHPIGMLVTTGQDLIILFTGSCFHCYLVLEIRIGKGFRSDTHQHEQRRSHAEHEIVGRCQRIGLQQIWTSHRGP